MRQPGSEEWSAELKRGEDALWEIAGDRAIKLVKEVEAGKVVVELPSEGASTSTDSATSASADTAADASTATATKPELTITPDPPSDNPAAFDVPFLSEATFRALILASPVLTTFFEQDLPQSFLLQPVERQTSTKDAFLSALNDAGQGGRGVTRERVKGLLGGLLGDVADAVGNRLQQQTVSGPKPSFNRGAGGRGISLEEAARTHGAGGKLAPVSPAALGRKTSTASLRGSGPGAAGGAGPDAAEALRLAQEALSQRDTSQFVIDAPGDETEDVDADVGDGGVEEDLDIAGGEGVGERGRVTGKEAQLAKGERAERGGVTSPSIEKANRRPVLSNDSLPRQTCDPQKLNRREKGEGEAAMMGPCDSAAYSQRAQQPSRCCHSRARVVLRSGSHRVPYMLNTFDAMSRVYMCEVLAELIAYCFTACGAFRRRWQRTGQMGAVGQVVSVRCYGSIHAILRRLSLTFARGMPDVKTLSAPRSSA